MVEWKETSLVVYDQPGTRGNLNSILRAMGFQADEASSGENGLDLARRRRYDIILVDISMPGNRGIETCRKLRRESPLAAILILTLHDSQDNKVEALDAGADGCLTKPFDLDELAARLRAVLRGRANAQHRADRIVIAEIALDSADRKVAKSGKALHLSPKQFEILEYLMRNAGIPIPHRTLLRAIWGPAYGDEVEYLRTFVCQLRKKVEDDPARPRYLTTYASWGYCFQNVEN